MAIAKDSWLSSEMEPKLMAPVANRFTISLAGSTLSIEMDCLMSFRKFNNPRKVQRRVLSSLECLANSA